MLQARSQWIAILPSCVRLISAWVAGRFSAALISTRYATPIRATIATTRMRMRTIQPSPAQPKNLSSIAEKA